MSTTDDDRLLSAVATALMCEPVPPPPDRIAEVRRRAELGRVGGFAVPRPAGRRRRETAPRIRWRSVAALAAVAAALAFSAGLTVGHDLPRPVRSVAYSVGLPVDSPRLVDARRQLDLLGEALGRIDPPRVEASDSEVVRLVTSLAPDERRQIEPLAREIHLRALEFLGAPAPVEAVTTPVRSVLSAARHDLTIGGLPAAPPAATAPAVAEAQTALSPLTGPPPVPEVLVGTCPTANSEMHRCPPASPFDGAVSPAAEVRLPVEDHFTRH